MSVSRPSCATIALSCTQPHLQVQVCERGRRWRQGAAWGSLRTGVGRSVAVHAAVTRLGLLAEVGREWRLGVLADRWPKPCYAGRGPARRPGRAVRPSAEWPGRRGELRGPNGRTKCSARGPLGASWVLRHRTRCLTTERLGSGRLSTSKRPCSSTRGGSAGPPWRDMERKDSARWRAASVEKDQVGSRPLRSDPGKPDPPNRSTEFSFDVGGVK
jgi:hypothetical protein